MSMALPQAQSSTSAPPKTSQAPPLPSKLGSLPAELLDNVLSFLDPESLIQASHTCRVLRSVYVNHNKSLWCAMAFSHPESTGKKHFKYVTWVENILLSEDNYEIRTALEMDLPRFHNRFLNTHLSFRQENMVTPRLQWELNRLAVIDTILTYLGKPINPAARFYWFEIDLHIDDFDPYVSDWYPIEGYDYDKHEETMVEIAKELMGVLESLVCVPSVVHRTNALLHYLDNTLTWTNYLRAGSKGALWTAMSQMMRTMLVAVRCLKNFMSVSSRTESVGLGVCTKPSEN